MVKDVEKRLLRLRRRYPFLDIVHNKHVYRLVESNEVVDGTVQVCVRILHLEQPCADIQHALSGIQLLALNTYCIDKMRLPAA